MPAKQWNHATEEEPEPGGVRQQPGDRAGGPVAVVDADDCDAGRTGGEHGEQRRHTLERRAVPGARRDGDDGRRREAPHHTGERALHAGDDHDRIRHGEGVELRQQAVESRNAAVGELRGREPSAPSTAMHSVATGRSAVPAVMTTTVPVRDGAGRKTTVASDPLSATAPGPKPSAVAAAVTAFTWGSVARVSRTGPSVSARSSSTTAAQCSGVLPGP